MNGPNVTIQPLRYLSHKIWMNPQKLFCQNRRRRILGRLRCSFHTRFIPYATVPISIKFSKSAPFRTWASLRRGNLNRHRKIYGADFSENHLHGFIYIFASIFQTLYSGNYEFSAICPPIPRKSAHALHRSGLLGLDRAGCSRR